MTLLARTSPTPNAPLLARQWLALYQQGPRWVPPLVQTGVLANLFLAFYSPSSPHAAPPLHGHHHQQQEFASLYYHLAAALLTFSILPLTFLVFEPGINGACKWKGEQLLSSSSAPLKEDGSSSNQNSTPDSSRTKMETPTETSTPTSTSTTTSPPPPLLLLPKKRKAGLLLSVERHSANEASKRWAERADMAGLVEAWARRNLGRAVVGVVAGGLGFCGVSTKY